MRGVGEMECEVYYQDWDAVPHHHQGPCASLFRPHLHNFKDIALLINRK